MTSEQTKIIKEAIIEYYELQEAVNKINGAIGNQLMLKLLSSGISQEEVQEIYLETIVKHAVRNIDSKSFDFLKPFIKREDNNN